MDTQTPTHTDTHAAQPIWAHQLAQELQVMRQAGTYKTHHAIDSPMAAHVRMDGRNMLVLSSNNYLGLASHPEVIDAGRLALAVYGAGTASVRFICGTFTVHAALEAALAELHRTEAALTYVSCWAANTGLLPAIAGAEDALLSDALNHASLIDGCRMSKARRLVYRHADMADLEAKLREVQGMRRVFIVTDGVFSMEGSIAPLPDILALARRYGAAVILDDSHGVGVMGAHGRGTAEYFGVEGQVDIITGTLGKALGGAAGGYVAGPLALTEYLQQVSRPQLFSNALPATIAASAGKAVDILRREPERVQRLHTLTASLRAGLQAEGLRPLDGPSAIVPLIVGDTALAIRLSQQLLEEGIFVTGFGYPVVPEGTARLRLQVSAALKEADIHHAVQRIGAVARQLGVA